MQRRVEGSLVQLQPVLVAAPEDVQQLHNRCANICQFAGACQAVTRHVVEQCR